MKKRTTLQRIGSTLVPLLALVVGLAWAGEKSPDGKTLFREYCKPCHGPDSAHGEVTPMTLIQEQWERFFRDQLVPSHGQAMDPKGSGKKLLEVLTPELLKKLKQFTMEHAADSEQPMTCG
ncbi:MAG: cytochrome c [Thermoanaerobaculum sp.]|nr:cytochrome c [Thermoanaerobaculum sp.]